MQLLFGTLSILVDGAPVKEREGTFVIPANKNYVIRLNNRTNSIMDYKIAIDGAHMGTWRVMPRDTITIKRPVMQDRQFFFTTMPAPTGRATNLSAPGKLVVEEYLCIIEEPYSDLVCDGPQGRTILDGPSHQQFTACPELNKELVAKFFLSMRPCNDWGAVYVN